VKRFICRSTLVLMALLPLAACGAKVDAGHRPASGIAGQAVIDAGCPVLRTASACPTRPATAHLRVSDPTDGRQVRAVDTGPDGRFRVALPAGHYEIDGRADGSPLPLAPVSVVVAAGRFAPVRLVFDSGVRTVR